MDQPLLADECYTVTWTLSSTRPPLTIYTPISPKTEEILSLFFATATPEPIMAFSLPGALLNVGGRPGVPGTLMALKTKARTSLPGL